jgi:hypothetical protein
MKELYLGLAITALIVLILTISVEVSASGSYLNRGKKKNVSQPTEASSISNNSISNELPARVYNKNNLNNVFLKKYYENKTYNPENNFYIPN